MRALQSLMLYKEAIHITDRYGLGLAAPDEIVGSLLKYKTGRSEPLTYSTATSEQIANTIKMPKELVEKHRHIFDSGFYADRYLEDYATHQQMREHLNFAEDMHQKEQKVKKALPYVGAGAVGATAIGASQ